MSPKSTTLLILLCAASRVGGQEGIGDRPRLPEREVPTGVQNERASKPYSNSRPISVSGDARVRRTALPRPTDRLAALTELPPPKPDPRPATPRSKKQSADRALITVGSSLAAVLGAFFLVVWVSRKTTPRGLAPLPGEVVESLGRAPLVGRQQAQLLRIGKKLVLVSITPTGVEPITEITEPTEVDRLAALCQQGRPGSITETFRGVLSQYGTESTRSGFIGR